MVEETMEWSARDFSGDLEETDFGNRGLELFIQ